MLFVRHHQNLNVTSQILYFAKTKDIAIHSINFFSSQQMLKRIISLFLEKKIDVPRKSYPVDSLIRQILNKKKKFARKELFAKHTI
jgi:hypothetical protein